MKQQMKPGTDLLGAKQISPINRSDHMYCSMVADLSRRSTVDLNN